MKNDLVDVFWLMIYQITLGSGKRLFVDGAIPAAFKLTESTIGSSGVIIANYEIANYERAGAIKTGTESL
jgi:dihydrofolate reductase